jgi:hypothetical protein
VKRVLGVMVLGAVLGGLAGCGKPKPAANAQANVMGPGAPPGMTPGAPPPELANGAGPPPPPDALPPLGSSDLLPAFKVAFGQPAPATLEVGRGDQRMTVSFEPAGFVPVGPDVVALISKGTNRDTCHACGGALSIHYLHRTPQGVEVVGAWTDAVQGGEFGAPPRWRTRGDLFENVALVAESAAMAQGCAVSAEDLVELTPQGPILRAENIPTGMSNKAMGPAAPQDMGVQDYRGRIVSADKGKTFTVNYFGSYTGSAQWARASGQDRYTPPQEPKRPWC